MSFRERFLRKLPEGILKFVFALCVTFLLLFAFSYPYIDRGSATFVVFVLALVPLTIMLIATIVLLYYMPKDEVPAPE